jgi:hypothetical protein
VLETRQQALQLELSDVHYVPGQKLNLYSITKAMDQGWSLGGNSKIGLYVRKGNKKIMFDVHVPTKNGIILGGYVLRTETATPNAVVKKQKPTISLLRHTINSAISTKPTQERLQ